MKAAKKPRAPKPAPAGPARKTGRTPRRPPGRPPRPDAPPETPEDPEAPEAPEPPVPAPPVENPQELEKLLLRLVSPLKSLPVQVNEGVVYVRPEEIAYITTTAERKLLVVDRAGREWRRFDSIKDMKIKLAGDPRFFLAHKSFLINVYAVRTLRRNPETKRIEVTFGDQVPGVALVASSNLKTLKDLLEL